MAAIDSTTLQIVRCEPYDVVMNWKQANLVCSGCSGRSFVKYHKEGRFFCKQCALQNGWSVG